MKKGIRFKLLVVFGVLILFVAASMGANLLMVKSQRKDSGIINLGGMLRMATQQMSKDALALSLGVEPARERLQRSSGLFEAGLDAMLNGGTVSVDEGVKVDIPPASSKAIRERLEKVKSSWDEFNRNVKVMVDRDSDLGAFTSSAKYIEANNMELLSEVSKAVDMYAAASSSKMNLLIISQVLTFFIAVGVAVGGLVVLTRMIVRPIGQVVGLAQSVASGDLTASDLQLKNTDEMGVLVSALNRMKAALSEMINNFKATSAEISSAVSQFAESSEKIVEGAERQSAQTEQSASSMEEMTSTVIEIARNSQEAAESAKKAQKTAEDGGVVVASAVKGMLTVAGTVKSSAEKVEALGRSSAQIGGIVEVINDIADQTNLLALNAAIEAARAGDQGRGFAVVADEVRKLAEKTSKATKQIAEMIKVIQDDTKAVMYTMNEGTKQAEDGVRLANNAGDALRQIVSSIEDVTDLVRLIATAAEEQSSTTENISMTITEIAGVARDTVEMMKQISGATEGLRDISGRLESLVNTFTVDQGGQFRGNDGPGMAPKQEKTVAPGFALIHGQLCK